MYTALYASLLAIWIVWLALQVVKWRRQLKVRYGDGGEAALIQARSAHANATETIPIALILLFCLETQAAHPILINLLGCALVIGRVLHGRAISNDRLKGRILGMQITLTVILTLAFSNLGYWVMRTLL
jgi:uncharacterized protein